MDQFKGPVRPSQFIGNTKRAPFGAAGPKLPFGEHGEWTDETIRQAHLTKDEVKRAREMKKVHDAFVEIVECMSYPVDWEGNIHDLNAIGPTKMAIAWTLALNGFRKTGKRYIKKRFYDGLGLYADAHTWVDARAPDSPEEARNGQPTDAGMFSPPVTTRRLADDAAPPMPEIWLAKPKITYDDDMRPGGAS